MIAGTFFFAFGGRKDVAGSPNLGKGASHQRSLKRKKMARPREKEGLVQLVQGEIKGKKPRERK